MASDYSLTITPTGRAYESCRAIIDSLCVQCQCREFEPHVTVQYVHDVDDGETVVRTLESITRLVEPFEIRLGDIGTFGDGVHARIVPSPELVGLYVLTQDALRSRGFRPYDYDAATWVPHLTLSCTHWQGDTLKTMFGSLDVSFIARRARVSRLEGSRWVGLRDLALGQEAPTLV